MRRILRQTPLHHRDQPVRGLGREHRNRFGLGLDDGRHRLRRGLALERPPAGNHLVDDRPQRELIGPESIARPATCSGDMYPGVPAALSVSVAPASMGGRRRGGPAWLVFR